jgi:hypothetical protein
MLLSSQLKDEVSIPNPDMSAVLKTLKLCNLVTICKDATPTVCLVRNFHMLQALRLALTTEMMRWTTSIFVDFLSHIF